jgi:ABC-2 type transport system ATP-binding protein
LIRPTAGTVRLLGHDMPHGAAAALDRVGALVENPKFFEEFTGQRNLRLLGRIRGIKTQAIEDILAQVGLADAADMKVRKYSLGMKQRLGVAATLLKDPELLVLDEPANGLDPAGIVEMRRMLRDLADGGKTVFVSSHQLGEIEQVCDDLVIIDHGKVVASGSVGQIVDASAMETSVITIDDPTAAIEALVAAGYEAQAKAKNQVVVEPAPENPADLTKILADAGLYLRGLRSEGRSLEEVFLSLTEGRSGDVPS